MHLFFSKKKQSNLFDNDKKLLKNSISLICPHCGNEQQESAMVLSTNCRKCSSYFKIINGAPILKPLLHKESFTNKHEQDSLGQKHYKKSRAHSRKDTSQTSEDNLSANSKLLFGGEHKTNKENSGRKVRCFECGTSNRVNPKARSSQCRSCSAYLSLADHNIKDQWNKRLQTCGNITVQKSGLLIYDKVRCNDLSIYGQVIGNVECTGDLTVFQKAKIKGKAQVKRLIIHENSEVHFSDTLYCEEAIISGEVSINFKCTGKITLKQKAKLTGDIEVGALCIEEGAIHKGRVSISILSP